jgi:hypothetical protein
MDILKGIGFFYNILGGFAPATAATPSCNIYGKSVYIDLYH